MNAGAIVAAQAAASQKAMMCELRDAGATRRDAATAYQRPAGGKGRLFDGLIKRGFIEKTDEDRYFLTSKGQAKLEKQETNGPMTVLILLVVFSVCASFIALIAVFAD